MKLKDLLEVANVESVIVHKDGRYAPSSFDKRRTLREYSEYNVDRIEPYVTTDESRIDFSLMIRPVLRVYVYKEV